MKEVTFGQVLQAVATITPVHQLMNTTGNLRTYDPELNKQAGTDLGIALIGAATGKVVDWVPTKLGAVGKAEEAIAQTGKVGGLAEGVASSAEATAARNLSGRMPSVMYGNTATSSVDAAAGASRVMPPQLQGLVA